MNRSNRGFALICLGISLWLILESSKYNYVVKYTPGPGFFPFWLGVLLAAFSIALLLETVIKKRGQKLKEPRRLPGRPVLFRVGVITLCTAGFSLLMKSLGFGLCVVLFVAGLLFFLERVSAVKSVITALIMSACVYLIFETWMEIGLPAGFLGAYLR